VFDRYLVALLTGAQRHISYILDYRDSGGRLCGHPFCKQEFYWDVPVSGTSSGGDSRSWIWHLRAIFAGSGYGLRNFGKNANQDTSSRGANQSDSWNGIRKLLVGR